MLYSTRAKVWYVKGGGEGKREGGGRSREWALHIVLC